VVGWVTTYVEARDDAVEGCCAVGVCRPHSAQPGAVVGYEGLGGRISQSCSTRSTRAMYSGFVRDVHSDLDRKCR
jgi:hypothetical protein